jgi:hypothetical protein
LEKVAAINYSGHEVRSQKLIKPLRNGYYRIIPQAIPGDAPKEFIAVYEYGSCSRLRIGTWPRFIAKVGHKWYPNESITEQLLTRLGQLLGLRMADSKLLYVKEQVRFLSRYFLKKDESLVHGAQIFSGYLEDSEFVEQVEADRESRAVFTIEFVIESIESQFPDDSKEILYDFVRMLCFDAIVGNNDRHFYNWGVIVNSRGLKRPVFSPIYDTARALFWNYSEHRLIQKTDTDDGRNRFIEDYVQSSTPKIGIDNKESVNHYQLIGHLWSNFPQFKPALLSFCLEGFPDQVKHLLNTEFSGLLSMHRREIIQECVESRILRFQEVLS